MNEKKTRFEFWMKMRIWECVYQIFLPQNLDFNPEWKVFLLFKVEFFLVDLVGKKSRILVSEKEFEFVGSGDEKKTRGGR
jgi:hypothetical protein